LKLLDYLTRTNLPNAVFYMYQVSCHSAIITDLDPTSSSLLTEAPLIEGSISSDVGEVQKTIYSVSDLSGYNHASSLKLSKFSPEELAGIAFTREMDSRMYLPH
jgi:hypothetical protein